MRDVRGSARRRWRTTSPGRSGRCAVQQDEVGMVLRGELQAERRLQCAQEPDLGTVLEEVLDETHVGEVVLDVEHGGGGRRDLARERGRRCAFVGGPFRRPHGKFEPERGAVPGRAVDPEGPAHRGDELLRQRETQAGAFDPGCVRLQPVEGNEESLRELGRDARAGVGDGDAHPLVVRLTVEGHAAAVTVELDRVGQEIEQHLLEPLAVAAHVPIAADAVDDLDAAFARLRRDEVEALAHERLQRHRFE